MPLSDYRPGECTLEITRFTVRNGQLLASGVLNGTITETGQAVSNLQVRTFPWRPVRRKRAIRSCIWSSADLPRPAGPPAHHQRNHRRPDGRSGCRRSPRQSALRLGGPARSVAARHWPDQPASRRDQQSPRAVLTARVVRHEAVVSGRGHPSPVLLGEASAYAGHFCRKEGPGTGRCDHLPALLVEGRSLIRCGAARGDGGVGRTAVRILFRDLAVVFDNHRRGGTPAPVKTPRPPQP